MRDSRSVLLPTGQDPDGWNHVQQGRIVTSPGPPPPPPASSPRPQTPSSRPSIFCPYHTARRAHFFLSSSPSLRPPLFIRPRPPPRSSPRPPTPRSWPFSFSLPPLFSHALLARARARARARYAPHQWQDRVLVLRRPAFLRIAHACHDIPSRELEERGRKEEREENRETPSRVWPSPRYARARARIRTRGLHDMTCARGKLV